MKKLEFNFTSPPRPPPWRRSCWSSWARPGSGSRPCSCRWPWTRPRWWSGAWWTHPPGHHHHYFFTIIINDDDLYTWILPFLRLGKWDRMANTWNWNILNFDLILFSIILIRFLASTILSPWPQQIWDWFEFYVLRPGLGRCQSCSWFWGHWTSPCLSTLLAHSGQI